MKRTQRRFGTRLIVTGSGSVASPVYPAGGQGKFYLSVNLWERAISTKTGKNRYRQARAAKKVAWKSIIGKRATVQGIAWEDSKGIGDRVILDGTTLYVDAGARFVQNQGRLVQVTGVFAKRTVPASPPESQGFVKAFEYYILEDAAVESIESVSSPHVVITE